ncbi:glutaredoxin-C9 [Ricinus communis]|uniref:Glutaredoxin, grx, putative n=1 Tax=Ricinus communis TaxID=3988 RepID=B9RB85_RICCO|nr:glutaredoxin-C9 [Ricinus communis]EEF50806.1 glutaredoxin, grx, putative [Ricinus communis]|eukprot:XP_002509419.1 glutaredoxin-C9 [Ricinus communis]
MQEAIPFRTYIPATATSGSNRQLPSRDGGNVLVLANGENYVQKLVLENSVIVFGKRGCCMCHVVKRLLLGLGVNPAVFEVDEKEETAIIDELSIIDGDTEREDGGQVQFPVVFVGGKLFGGLERVMATHISGELVPILKDAGALWL